MESRITKGNVCHLSNNNDFQCIKQGPVFPNIQTTVISTLVSLDIEKGTYVYVSTRVTVIQICVALLSIKYNFKETLYFSGFGLWPNTYLRERDLD